VSGSDDDDIERVSAVVWSVHFRIDSAGSISDERKLGLDESNEITKGCDLLVFRFIVAVAGRMGSCEMVVLRESCFDWGIGRLRLVKAGLTRIAQSLSIVARDMLGRDF
jgi:hypothetical protein